MQATDTGPVIRVPHATCDGDGTARQEITALFTNPDGSELPVKVTLFQLAHGPIGVGVYPTAGNGAVLRWDDGPEAEPTLIHWQAPHCADDQCGAPCEHRHGRNRGRLSCIRGRSDANAPSRQR